MKLLIDYLHQVVLAVRQKEPVELEALGEAIQAIQAEIDAAFTELENRERLGLQQIEDGWRDVLGDLQDAVDLAALAATQGNPEAAEQMDRVLDQARQRYLGMEQQVEFFRQFLDGEMALEQ